MSPVNKVGVLAFATAVAAVPHAGHGHAHLHKRSAPAAYSASSSNGAAAYAASSSYLAAGYGYGSSSYYGTGSGYAKPTGYYGSSSSSGPCSYTSTCIWRSKTSVSTVYGHPTASAAAYSAPAYSASADPSVPAWVYSYASDGYGAQASAACAPDVTVTAPVYVTVTATYTASDSYAAAGYTSSGSAAAPAYTSEGAGYDGAWSSSAAAATYSSNGAAYGGSWSSSAAAAAYSSDGAAYGGSWGSSAAAYSSAKDTTCTDDPTATWSSSAQAYATSSSAGAYAYGGSWGSSSSDPAGYSATSSYAAAASSYPQARDAEPKHRRHHHAAKARAATMPATGFSSKRGLAYNDASLCDAFASSGKMGWGYNWVSSSGGLTSAVSYIPELHDASSAFTASWASDAQAGINSGAQYLFSFNEPDMPTQANMAPADAATAWRTYMEPFAGKAKLVAPAVSNSGATGQGIDWLTQFMAACSDCTIDAVNAHWYDSTSNDISLFQSQIGAMGSKFGLPVFVGEFGFIGSDSDISTSMTSAMSYMDSNPDVVGYAYFMVADGNLVSGSSLSSTGTTYMS